MKKNQKGFGLIEIVLIIVAVLIIGALGWILYRNMNGSDKTQSTSTKNTASTSNPKTAESADPYAGWKTYSSTMSSVTFKYPATWTLQNYPSVNQKQGAMENISVLSSVDSQGRVFAIGLQVNGDQYSGTAPSRIVDKVVPINSNYLIMYNVNGTGDGVTSLSLSKENMATGTTNDWFEYGFQTSDKKPITFSGELKVPGQQESTAYPVDDYVNSSVWQDVLLIFKSVSL